MGNLRVDWVDTAKGLCIILVVMMHSTLGVQAATGAEGWMRYPIAFAAPFRMPDFFLIAGLFLAKVIDRRWPLYLDRKVVHFLYFYALWLTIQFAFKTPGFVAELGVPGTIGLYFWSYIEPFGTLWFIYILPIFFVVCKFAHDFRIPHWAMFAFAALLHLWSPSTGFHLADQFCTRFVFFYVGYAAAPFIFSLAQRVSERPVLALSALVVWAAINGGMVVSGLHKLTPFSLTLGFLGAMALVSFASLAHRFAIIRPITWLGSHSIVIYLAFFLPMAITRIVLVKTGIISDVGTISLLVTVAGVAGPAIFYLVIRRLRILHFLFNRPKWATLPIGRDFDRSRTSRTQPAE